MATANTFVQIGSTVTVGGAGAATISFSSIPATYTDLKMVISARSDRSGTIGDNLSIALNGSYSDLTDRRLYADGSAAYSYSDSAAYLGFATASSATASVFGSTEIYIPNYTSSNAKSMSSDGVAENNGSSTAMGLDVGLWNPATQAAITSITISSRYSATFQQYSTASLYGILKY